MGSGYDQQLGVDSIMVVISLCVIISPHSLEKLLRASG